MSNQLLDLSFGKSVLGIKRWALPQSIQVIDNHTGFGKKSFIGLQAGHLTHWTLGQVLRFLIRQKMHLFKLHTFLD